MNLKYIYKIVLLILLISAFSCIDTFKPELSSSDINKLVVNGSVTNEEGYQTVKISRSSNVSSPEFDGVSNCDVKIYDSNGNIFQLDETSSGIYTTYIPKEYLYEGNAFKVEVNTPEDQLIVSEFDTLYACPDIDSVYYQKEEILSNNQSGNIPGYQFYVDFNGTNYNVKYLKWKLEETWEYHARYPKKWYYDRSIHEIKPPDYGTFYCYNTKIVPNIFTLNTTNIAGKIYKKHPINFVDNRTQRLMYNYSLLVMQSALSKSAYNYYTKLEQIINNEGGLYEKQPVSIKGNLTNITDPEQEVLGFFQAEGISKKRIVLKKAEDLEFNYQHGCAIADMTEACLCWISDDELPAMLWFTEEGRTYWIFDDCYDCRRKGGVTKKPDIFK